MQKVSSGFAGMYASLARTLNKYSVYHYKYSSDDIHPPVYIDMRHETRGMEENSILQTPVALPNSLKDNSFISAGSIWLTFEAMQEVSRPDDEFYWQQFSSSSRIAWKTGTSFGNRDGWAIGCNPKYVVAVWVGNADGEGRPDLTGINTAAPILFDIFKVLQPTGWFKKPENDMTQITVCRYSGYKAGPSCEATDRVWVQKGGENIPLCPYHQIVHLDKTEKWLVNSDCEQVSDMVTKSWFVLPPVMEYYFKMKNPFYKVLPQWRSDCNNTMIERKSMELIYPKTYTRLYIPIEISGEEGKTVFKVAHRTPGITIYWHLDDKYLGSTTNYHQMELSPDAGIHTLTLVDQNGETLTQKFEILKKSSKNAEH